MTALLEDGTPRTTDTARVLVVSVDDHVGPRLLTQLREYCPPQHREAFDEHAARPRPGWTRELHGFNPPQSTLDAIERTRLCDGQNDPHARLRDLDADGVAAEVVFAGGQNGERIPFIGEGLGAVPGAGAAEDVQLQELGFHIYNHWLSDFLSVEPARHVGLAHIPIWDVDAAVREVEWARSVGLKGVNLPAPRSLWAPYNDDVYEPLWAACEDLNMVLCSHAGGGDDPLGASGRNASACFAAEINWLGRRSLWQLIFGGVFERHPGLKMVYTEQRGTWVPATLRELDSIWRSPLYGRIREDLPRSPSEYWATNCYIGGSFIAPHEVAARHEIGLQNLMWGSDYPHQEGTWPNTLLAQRYAFSDVPEQDVRRILGLNALEVFDLDAAELQVVADRIGPTIADIAEPVAEMPEHRGLAFREHADFD
ncbi:MAG TPA: amidohydrolase family protein [Jatrophihabitans sp.]|jgi:predicted TIM-barrel fold metal-dependent hydrolase